MTSSEQTASADALTVPSPTSDATARGAEAFVAQAPAWILALLAAGVPLVMWSAVVDQVVIPRLAATALLTALALLTLAMSASPSVNMRHARVPLALLTVFIAWSALSTAAGVDVGGSLMGESRRYQGLLPLLMYAALLVAAMLATARLESPRVSLAGVFVGGAVAGGYALLQRLGLDWVEWQGVSPGRVGASFAQPNVLGVELVTAGIASLALWRDAASVQRSLLLSGTFGMLAALIFTDSRGAWVGLAAGGVAFAAFMLLTDDAKRMSLALRVPAPRTLASIVLPAVAVVAAAAGTVAAVPPARHAMDRATSATNVREASISAHIGLWRTSLQMIGDRPLRGGGPESFSTLFAEYRTRDQPEFGTANIRPESSHNFFLDQAVGTGVIGLVILIALIGAVITVAVRRARSDPRRRQYTGAIAAAVVAYYAAVFFSFSEAMTGWLPWLLMGALLGLAISSADTAAPSSGGAADQAARRPMLPVAFRATGAGFAVVLLVVAYLVIAADWRAGRAHVAAAAGRYGAAAIDARRASDLNPLDRQYLYDLGAYEEAAALTDPTALDRALSAYEQVDDRFAPTAYGRLSEARVLARMYAAGRAGVDRTEIARLLEEGARLDPYNAEARREIASIYRAIGNLDRAAEFDAP